MTPATRVHVLWTPSRQPDLELIQANTFGLAYTQIETSLGKPPLVHLRAGAMGHVFGSHLLFVVTDSATQRWAEAAKVICEESGSNAPIHVVLTDDERQGHAACLAIRTLCELLSTDGPVGVDLEDVRLALGGSGVAHIATATAAGHTRAQDALDQAMHHLETRKPPTAELSGLFVIFSGASNSLGLKEVSSSMKQVQSSLSADTRWAYGIVQDDALGDALQLVAFAKWAELDEPVG